jgi:hypothetical protein
MHKEKAVLIRSYLSTADDFFKNKEDALEEMLEELNGNMLSTFESLYAGRQMKIMTNSCRFKKIAVYLLL